MRKIFYLLGFFGVVCFGCEKVEFNSDGFELERQTGVNLSYQEARDVAMRAIPMLQGTRSSMTRTLDDENVSWYVRKNLRTGDARDTLMYIFNFKEGGFAVVATDRRVDKLIAFAEKGKYLIDNEPNIQEPGRGIDLYMNYMSSKLEALSAEPISDLPSEPGRTQIRERVITREIVNPKVSVEWGEAFPYNLYCSTSDGTRTYAGCAATAVAQIMEAYSFPETMQFTYPNADISSVELDWSGLRIHKNTNTCDFSCPEHQTTARIFREIGQRLGMEYLEGVGNNKVDFANVPDCLHSFGFSAESISEYSFSAIGKSLMAGKMVCMYGQTEKNKTHIWVVDGYQNVSTATEIWFLPDSGGAGRLIESHTKTVRYTHCNWGFDGDCNGYFAMDVFDMTKPEIPDNSDAGKDYNFTLNLKMVTGIAPIR